MGPPPEPAPRTYSVVATPGHIDAMAWVTSSPRSWSLLPWLAVLSAAWFGFALGVWLLHLATAGAASAFAALSAFASAVFWGWLMALFVRRVVRKKMRELLVDNGWHVGSEHHAEFRDHGFTLRGPTSEVSERYAHLRSLRVDRGGVLLRRRESRTPLISVADLFPEPELERVRRGIADGRGQVS
jgi:hypothetical protein